MSQNVTPYSALSCRRQIKRTSKSKQFLFKFPMFYPTLTIIIHSGRTSADKELKCIGPDKEILFA